MVETSTLAEAVEKARREERQKELEQKHKFADHEFDTDIFPTPEDAAMALEVSGADLSRLEQEAGNVPSGKGPVSNRRTQGPSDPDRRTGLPWLIDVIFGDGDDWEANAGLKIKKRILTSGKPSRTPTGGWQLCFGDAHGIGWGELLDICVTFELIEDGQWLQATSTFMQRMRCSKSHIWPYLDVSFTVWLHTHYHGNYGPEVVCSFDRVCGTIPFSERRARRNPNYDFSDVHSSTLVIEHQQRVHGC